jgi:hypothetical protein
MDSSARLVRRLVSESQKHSSYIATNLQGGALPEDDSRSFGLDERRYSSVVVNVLWERVHYEQHSSRYSTFRNELLKKHVNV